MMRENLYMGMTLDGVAELARGLSAFAVQVIDEMGGIRMVELLLAAGFIIGLLACMYEIKAIER